MGRRWLLPVLLLLQVCVADVANACTCPPRSAGCGPPADFWHADGVFTGRVLSVDRADGVNPAEGRQRRVRVRVAERFRGSSPAPGGVAIVFTPARCGYPFKVGADYVIYTTAGEDGRLMTTLCSRTVPLDRAGADLAYGRLVASGAAPRGVVVGDVRYAPEHDPRRTPVAGVAVTAIGSASQVTSVTDARGRYTIELPAAGRYALSVNLPATSYAAAATRTIELADARACVQRDVDVLFDGQLAGRIVDSRGRGVAGLTVAHVRLRKDGGVRPDRTRALTRDDGGFRIDRVPPGPFAVVVELPEDHVSGATDENDALPPGLFRRGLIGGGERLSLDSLVLPADVRLVRLEGSVHGSDGAPAAGARVFLKDDAEAGRIVGAAAIADDLGRFVLAVLEDEGYQVFAERPMSTGTSSGLDFSDPVSVNARAGMPPLRLTVRRRF